MAQASGLLVDRPLLHYQRLVDGNALCRDRRANKVIDAAVAESRCILPPQHVACSVTCLEHDRFSVALGTRIDILANYIAGDLDKALLHLLAFTFLDHEYAVS